MKSLYMVMFGFSLLLSLTAGCAAVKTEFYRGETTYQYTAGTEAYQQGNYAAAKSHFQQVVKYDPNYAQAYAALGNIALIEKEYEVAESWYEKAVEVNRKLESELHPLIFTNTMLQVNQPLEEAGVTLADIYAPLMENDFAAVDLLLEKDVPLDLLAHDSISLTAGKLGELRSHAGRIIYKPGKSGRLNLFLCYLIYFGEVGDEPLADFLQNSFFQTGADMPENIRQEAYFLTGKVLQRLEHLDQAVEAFVDAVNSGMEVELIAPSLARIYDVDEDEMLTRMHQAQKMSVSSAEPLIHVALSKYAARVHSTEPSAIHIIPVKEGSIGADSARYVYPE